MSAITVQELGPYGEGLDDLTFTALTELTNTFVNDGQTILIVKSTHTTAIALTVSSVPDPYGRGGGGDNDLLKTVPIGNVTTSYAMTGFLNTSLWGGVVDFDVDISTAVSVAAVRIRR